MLDLSLGFATLVLSALLIALGSRWKVFLRIVVPTHSSKASPMKGHGLQIAPCDVASALKDSVGLQSSMTLT